MKNTSKEKLICEAGKKLFGNFGAKRVTVDMIVKEAGVAKGTFYLYYKNKINLYENIIEDHIKYVEKIMLYLYEEIPDVKERFLQHMIGSLNFFEKNKIIKNLIDRNEDYLVGKITTKYLYTKHINFTKILIGDDFSDEESINIASNVKGIFAEILNHKNHFKNNKEYQEFVINYASIIVEGLFGDYKILLKGRSYQDFISNCKKF